MRLFRVRGRLTGPTGRSEEAELPVDTGATLLVVPRSLAERLELVARRSQPVLIAGDQRAEWPVAEVSLSFNGPGVTTPCFIAPDGPALLGAVALDSLFLAVDPKVAARLNALVEHACAASAACAEDDGAVTLNPPRYTDLAYRISQICIARRPAAYAPAGEPAFLGQDHRGATLAIAVPRGRLPLAPWRYAVRPNSS